MAKQRLDLAVFAADLAPSRERAQALILGGHVTIDGQTERRASTSVPPGAVVALRAPDHPYVSRGALKLEHGLAAFAIDPVGRVCLDVGASTGGFTDLLLRRGASRVYAIDVGYGQLDYRLRQDARVVVIERTNVRDMDLALVPEPAQLAVIDVSFISLTLVLPRVAQLLRDPGQPIIALVKPQFEAGREAVSRGGVVRDPETRLATVEKVAAWAAAHGFAVGGHVESPITGPAGNVEYLLELRSPAAGLAASGT